MISTTSLTFSEKDEWKPGELTPIPLAILKENEAILKTRSDVVKNEEGDDRKL